jgi:hypothetical protein
MDSRVSVMLSPSFASLPPQHGHAAGAGTTTRSRGRCAGNGARTGLRRVKPRTLVSAGCSAAASLACGRLHFLELQLHLVEQFATVFGGRREAIVLEFGDHQLEMRHDRLGAGGTRFRFAPRLLLGG